ncbi:ShlB/FhaC/HecB family hemolysin secretion/activation protein [Altererythrobacter sp.]|uniref:ShlB/FhaC/HecB family hemolysin secretion/activation protein n=1 Tax=Altererythrobacter sp. TaxID=1872480 RepID=UPI003CFFFDBA
MKGTSLRSTGLHHARRALGASLLVLAAMPSLAQAQVAIAPTREEIQRQEIERDLRDDSSPLAATDGVERAPCPLADPQFAELRFTMGEAKFPGLGDLDPAMLAPAWQGYAGREIPVSAICEIRDRAATILRDAGYLAAVQVPEQTITSGTVVFDVVLARLASVQVRGEAGKASGLLQRYIAKLEGQGVFNANEAERYLLLARDIPGLNVRLTLQPMPRELGGEPGDVVGVFDVSRQPFYVDANIQNYGSRAVGRFGGLLRARVNNVTGMGDETLLSAFATEDFKEQIVLQSAHSLHVGSEGMTLNGGFTYAWTKPDVPGPNLFESETLIASGFASYPLVRSQARNITLSGGFELIDQALDFSGLALSQDKLRIAFVKAQLDSIDRGSVLGRGGYSIIEPRRATGVSLELRQGLDMFGASKGCGAGFVNCLGAGLVPPSRLDADPTGFLLRGDAYAEIRPKPDWGLRLRGRFQYSPDPLLNFEQFSGGNYTIGRGYDPGAMIGDSGVGIQLEAFQGSLVPKTPDGIAVQPFIFGDYAGAWTHNLADDYAEIFSVGGGLRSTIGRQAVLDLTGAVPLKRPPLAASKGDFRVLMSLTVQLAPWYK